MCCITKENVSRELVNNTNIQDDSDLKLSIKPINTSGGQCLWCGCYGHSRGGCPLLK